LANKWINWNYTKNFSRAYSGVVLLFL